MEFGDNKYYDFLMSTYLINLIEMHQYKFRCNKIFVPQSDREERARGVYEAMWEIAEAGEKVVCVNFDKYFSVVHTDNLHYYIGSTAYYLNPVPCDYMFIFNRLPQAELDKIISYYNPLFIFYC